MLTKIWGHRGASGDAPENTLAAFQMASSVGADGIELDVHFTRDREIVVTHDDDTARVTGYKGLISNLTLAQLKKLDFSCGMAAYKGETIPTLEEVLALIKPGKLHINIELKTNDENPNGLEEACQALVEKCGMEERILYSSFNHYSLARMRSIAPHMKCGTLYSNKPYRPWEYAKSFGCSAVHPQLGSVNTIGYMEECHKAGIACNVWTVNSAQDIKAMLDLAVDGIITNYPALALRLRDEK
jgi:glycerophosphoryl diester phosphodiesterase